MVSPLALKLLPYIIAAAALVGGYLYVTHLQEKVEEQQAALIKAEEERIRLNEALIAVTDDKKALDEEILKSEAQRAAVRAELNRTLAKLRSQRPPVECKAAIDWAVENKGDLQW
jgi:chromosome segregation ATPase